MIFILITLISVAYLFLILSENSGVRLKTPVLLYESCTCAFIFAASLAVGQTALYYFQKNLHIFEFLLIRFLLLMESFFYINISLYFFSHLITENCKIFARLRHTLYLLSLVFVVMLPVSVTVSRAASGNLLLLEVLRTVGGSTRLSPPAMESFYNVTASCFLMTPYENMNFPAEMIIVTYRVILPLISAVAMFFDAGKNALKIQKAFFNAAALIFLWLGWYVIRFACRHDSSFIVFIVPFYVCALLTLIKSEKITGLFRRRYFIMDFAAVFLRFILPSLLCALMYIPVCSIYKKSPPFAWVFFGFYVLGIINLAYWANDKFRFKTGGLADRYKADFENEIASLDYKQEPSVITMNIASLFKKYAYAGNVLVVIPESASQMKVIYSSNETNFRFSADDVKLFDFLAEIRKEIVFASDAGTDARLDGVSKTLSSLFRRSASEALIVMHEGLHVSGVFLLGKKINGHGYNSYDRIAFSDLYSYFFVYSYFIQNAANKSILSVFAREVNLSSQIITSIRQNMDLPDQSRMDVSYRMLAAREIGGEFVDMIKLSDDEHFFVLGALAGRGVSASMNMVILRNFIRTYVSKNNLHGGGLIEFADKVNSFIIENLPKETFFSGAFLFADLKKTQIRYINCGVPAIFLYSAELHNVTDIEGKGCVLGVLKDIHKRIAVKERQLHRGDVVFMCTDGLIDSRSVRGESFGGERIRLCIEERNFYPADQIIRHILNQLAVFMPEEISNDITALVLRSDSNGQAEG
ncbi:PP2C family protein-serine/threonine phosphatase [Treponema parvum]|uniref:PP2C family protein-serine/threonine phosphatase n=1 Tax=Treponema parvum TaxID=138851 RepID=UPI001AEC70BF|nr:PP2C family protein-serine/threonine phosphatase [Treponema parvum]QTQ16862.1 serine/threonine-protein phosphatase [Treponema parvum]